MAFDDQVGIEDRELVEGVHRGIASGALEHGYLMGRQRAADRALPGTDARGARALSQTLGGSPPIAVSGGGGGSGGTSPRRRRNSSRPKTAIATPAIDDRREPELVGRAFRVRFPLAAQIDVLRPEADGGMRSTPIG